MPSPLDEILAANAAYAARFDASAVVGRFPTRRFAIVTCMDARLEPFTFAGLRPGDAHIIRNAGGRASDDVIRSLVISARLMGTETWFVIHHTDCGMGSRTEEEMRDLFTGHAAEVAGAMDWLTIPDQVQGVVDDVTKIRRHPLVPGSVVIYGYVYDVHTGRLLEVPEATVVGRAVGSPPGSTEDRT